MVCLPSQRHRRLGYKLQQLNLIFEVSLWSCLEDHPRQIKFILAPNVKIRIWNLRSIMKHWRLLAEQQSSEVLKEKRLYESELWLLIMHIRMNIPDTTRILLCTPEKVLCREPNTNCQWAKLWVRCLSPLMSIQNHSWLCLYVIVSNEFRREIPFLFYLDGTQPGALMELQFILSQTHLRWGQLRNPFQARS